MRYGDLEMFLCGLELTHLLPKFQVKLHLILLIWENISNDYTIIINCFLLILWLFILMSTSQLLQCLWVSVCEWVSVGEPMGGWVSGWVTGCVSQWVGHWMCEAVGWSLGVWSSRLVTGWMSQWVSHYVGSQVVHRQSAVQLVWVYPSRILLVRIHPPDFLHSSALWFGVIWLCSVMTKAEIFFTFKEHKLTFDEFLNLTEKELDQVLHDFYIENSQ